MKRQLIFSVENKKNITNLSSAVLAQSVVKVNDHTFSFSLYYMVKIRQLIKL